MTHNESAQSNEAEIVKEIEDVLDDVGVDEVEYQSPSFENVLEYLGMPGRYQITQIVLCMFTMVIQAFIAMSIVFLGYTPNHECREVNETQLIHQHSIGSSGNIKSAHVYYESCGIKIAITFSNQNDTVKGNNPITTNHSMSCPNGRKFFSAKDSTYTSEWDLVCEAEGQVEFSQNALTIGQTIGGLISSPLSDRFGRKRPYVIAACLSCLLEVAHVLAPNFVLIYVVKFLSGLAIQTYLTCGTVYMIELVIPRHRQKVIIAHCAFWVFSLSIAGGVAYFVQDKNWRYFHVVSIGFGLTAFLTPFILRESPRWLAANDRHDEALDILKLASKQNGKDFQIVKRKFDAYVRNKYASSNPSAQCLVRYSITDDSYVSNNKESSATMKIMSTQNISASVNVKSDENYTHASSPFTMLFHKRLILFLVVGSYLWLTNVLTYYGLFMTSSELAGNRFLNFILMGLVELPSYALVLYILNIMGRRIVFGIFMGLTGLCLMISALMSTIGVNLPGSETIITVMFISGKFSISASFAVLVLLTPELFPTNVRTTAYGFCNALGRLGNMVAPFLRLFHDKVKWGPAFIFTTMSFVAVLVSLYLPETKDKDLPTTLEDLDLRGKTAGVKRGKKEKDCVVAVRGTNYAF